MPRSLASYLLVITVAVAGGRPGPGRADAGAAGQRPVDFAAEIQPLLAANCLGCHGETLKLSRLDLRTRDSAIEGGSHGPSLVPGSAERSRMYRHVAGLESPAMPMRGAPLSAGGRRHAEALDRRRRALGRRGRGRAVIGVRRGGDRGAADHRRRAQLLGVPAAARRRRCPTVGPAMSHPVDRFLEQARRGRGLVAAPAPIAAPWPAGPISICSGCRRRPPRSTPSSPTTRPDAWERLIDTLLASPHYGERYGRHWLDVVRYADSGGFEYDVHRPNAWRYRDYVIQAFNADMPYDRFLVEQIAGDEIDGTIRRQPGGHRLPARRAAGAVPGEGQPGTALRLPRRRHRRDRQGHAGADHRLRAVPRPQVRSDPAEGLLRAAGVDLRLRRDRGAAGAEAPGRRPTWPPTRRSMPAATDCAPSSPPSTSRIATGSSWR